MKNYSELIRSKNKRVLTAKGCRFLWRCIDVIALQNNTSRYSTEIKPLKEKLTVLIHHLIIDKGCSIEDIKAMIKNRTLTVN